MEESPLWESCSFGCFVHGEDCRVRTPAAMGLDSGCAPCGRVLDAIAETFDTTIDWLDERSRPAGSSAGSSADWGGVLAAHLRASASEEQRVFGIRFLRQNWEYVHPACLLVFHGYVSGLAEHLVASCPDVAPRATAAFLRRCARRADDYLLASFQATILRVQQVLEVGRFAAGARLALAAALVCKAPKCCVIHVLEGRVACTTSLSLHGKRNTSRENGDAVR